MCKFTTKRLLPAIISLGWKSESVSNDIAYYDMALITALRRFMVQVPGVNIVKLFYYQFLYFRVKKQVNLSSGALSGALPPPLPNTFWPNVS
jgi:hypothetical protein